MSWMIEPGKAINVRFVVEDSEAATDVLNHLERLNGRAISDLTFACEPPVNKVKLDIVVEREESPDSRIISGSAPRAYSCGIEDH